MTVSVHKLNPGNGYAYFTKSIAAGDGDRLKSTTLTRYYAATGTPPGFWMGAGLGHLGSEAEAHIHAGQVVTEEQLARLIGQGHDPVTGAPLGRKLADFVEQPTGPTRKAVSGYDVVFSLPKSASIMWAVADAETQALIVNIHHETIAEVLRIFERQVAATRKGSVGPDGKIDHPDVSGVVATAFDHYDSRVHDPQLHTHVVISNRAMTIEDGKWRSLDGRLIYPAIVALSELHEGLLMDALTRDLGVRWDQRTRGKNRNDAWEITGVSEDLVAGYSKRSHEIDVVTEQLIAEYVDQHGRRPSANVITGLRQRATLSTREDKEVLSLADLSARWRHETSTTLGTDATQWARDLTTDDSPATDRAEAVPHELVAMIGERVLDTVSSKRPTWRHWNLYAEASRQLQGWRFATARDREIVVEAVVAASKGESIQLTPPELATVPTRFVRDDGTSRLRMKHSEVFTRQSVLDAEARLIARSNVLTGPRISAQSVDTVLQAAIADQSPTDEQAAALQAIATSGRVVDVLVGPAGTGKTTTMLALATAWKHQHGPGSVVGLASTAKAAEILAAELAIDCENTAMWLTQREHHPDKARLHRGDLVIIDEASMLSLTGMDTITAAAELAGAKVLLVGDWAQLQSVETGGTFSMLAKNRPDVAELSDVHRFTHEWEKKASLLLRDGKQEVLDHYFDHERVHAGTGDAMITAAFHAWSDDIQAGKASVLVANSRETVAALNAQAQRWRSASGQLGEPAHPRLADASPVSVGDWVITRRNDRSIRTHDGWVRNGDRWIVRDIHDDGSLVVHAHGRRHGRHVTLPASYVAQDLDLGYAVTAYRAQGMTVDTAHVVTTAATTRENFYVAMTRGRETNTTYVALDRPDDDHTGLPDELPSAYAVLTGVLSHVGAEPTAHLALADEQDRWNSPGQFMAEYETIAAAAQSAGWLEVIRTSGLSEQEVSEVAASQSFGSLCLHLRKAEASGRDADQVLAEATAQAELHSANDAAAVLVHRLDQLEARSRSRMSRVDGKYRFDPARAQQQTRDFICGLIPRALGPMSADERQALDEREHLIRAGVLDRANRAMTEGHEWLRHVPPPPFSGERDQRDWQRSLLTVVAYRERHNIVGPDPLGPEPGDRPGRSEYEIAVAGLRTMHNANGRTARERTPMQARIRTERQRQFDDGKLIASDGVPLSL